MAQNKPEPLKHSEATLKNLRDIDRLLADRNVGRGRLRKLYAALLEARGYHAPSYKSVSVAELTSARIGRDSQRFFAAAMLRLLADEPETFYNDTELSRAASRLFQAIPDVSKRLKVSPDAQTYKKLQTLQTAFPQARTYLAKAVRPIDNLQSFTAVRQGVMRALNHSFTTALITPFLPSSFVEHTLPDALKHVDSYLASSAGDRYQTYHIARSRCETLEASIETADIGLMEELFLPFARSLMSALEDHFNRSPFSQPARLEVNRTPRKYPLGEADLQPRLEFRVTNHGPGYALGVELVLEVEPSRVKLHDSGRYLGTLEPGATLGKVQFAGRVLRGDRAPLLAEATIGWANADGGEQLAESIFELEAQQVDIAWEELESQDPYSLEPVETLDELVGRRDLVNQMLSRLRARRSTSFWIFGQKRVGKTSLVKTVRTELQDDDIVTIYLEAGDYIDPDPERTVARLGAKLCQQLRRSDDRLRSLEVPQFRRALAPLSDFLDAARRTWPDLRIVIMLDEFDELPVALYQRGELGNAFFLSLRSISAKAFCSFILVGGEKMQLVLSTQGDALNKFRTLRVDYLDSSKHWADFEDLIRRPVSGWALFTDTAIKHLYDISAGNPFFAKYVASVVLEDMLSRRDAFVDDAEVGEALDTAVWQAGANQFQHFWDDGIFERSGDREEEVSVLRRRVLLGVAEALRQEERPSEATISQYAGRYGVPPEDVATELNSFHRRGVIMHSSNMGYRPKVGLFSCWLEQRGIHEIITTFTQLDEILKRRRREEEAQVRSEEITDLVKEWGLYRGEPVGADRVRAWLNQFREVEEQRLMFELLKNVRFFSDAAVRSRFRDAQDKVRRRLAQKGVARRKAYGGRKSTDSVLVSYLGPIGKRGPSLAKMYVDENSIYYERVVRPARLISQAMDLPDVEGVVLVEDFVGTGGTALGYLGEWYDELKALHEEGIELFLVLVAGFGEAVDKIRRQMEGVGIPMQIYVADPLGDEDRCFHPASAIFPEEAKRVRAREIATHYGMLADSKQPIGYDDSAAAVVFEAACPNNSLAVLWGSGKEWRPLFPRR